MEKIAITLDERTAAWARVQAAEHNMSLSRYVCEMLREKLRHSNEYQKAYLAFLAEKSLRLRGPGERFLTREGVNDRAALRRR
jgi:plasmid stability protein